MSMPETEWNTTTVQGSCGHPIEVRFPAAMNEALRREEIRVVQLCICGQCARAQLLPKIVSRSDEVKFKLKGDDAES